jgi:hypothetical protein
MLKMRAKDRVDMARFLPVVSEGLEAMSQDRKDQGWFEVTGPPGTRELLRGL